MSLWRTLTFGAVAAVAGLFGSMAQARVVSNVATIDWNAASGTMSTRSNRVDIQANDISPGIKLPQQFCGGGIGFVVAELGRDHGAIAHVVVHIARHEVGFSRTDA